MKLIINFEGIHGSGKTTQIGLLESSLLKEGREAIKITAQDKPFSEYAIKFLRENGPQSPEVLFYLSIANNFGTQRRLGEENGIFLLDRYIYTDIASTYLAGKDFNWIYGCLKPFIFPDKVILLDVDPEKALERKDRSTNDLERGCFQSGFETDGFVKYQQRLRDSYLKIASIDNRIVVIDGERPIKEVHNEVRTLLGI